MQNNNAVPTGYISVDDAIKLIKKDTRENAVVDLSWLARNFNWIQLNHNLTIKLMKTENGKAVPAGKTAIQIRTPLQLEQLKETIRQAYRERTRREINEESVRSITTSRGDGEGASRSGNPEINPVSKAKSGDELPAHTISQTLTGAGV